MNLFENYFAGITSAFTGTRIRKQSKAKKRLQKLQSLKLE